jgi:hypothetical protein
VIAVDKKFTFACGFSIVQFVMAEFERTKKYNGGKSVISRVIKLNARRNGFIKPAQGVAVRRVASDDSTLDTETD